MAMGEKDGFITPERLEMLVNELLKHKNFDALSLPGLSEDRKAVFAPGLAILCGVFDALAIKELRLSDGALREGVLYEMEGRFRHGIFVAARHRVWQISTTSIANRHAGYWKLPPRCWSSGRSRIPSWPIRTSRRC